MLRLRKQATKRDVLGFRLPMLAQPGYNYLKTGIRATVVIPAGEVQYNLFSDYANSK